MILLLKELGNDWWRAPLSGTMLILCVILAMGALNALNIDRMLLYLILANVVAIQRRQNAEK